MDRGIGKVTMFDGLPGDVVDAEVVVEDVRGEMRMIPRQVAVRRAHMEDRKYRFLKALSEYRGLVSVACNRTGIAHSNHSRWMREDPAYAEAVAFVREAQIDKVESKLFDNIEKGNEASIMFYLKCKAKHRGYIERSESVNVNLNANFKDLTDDELELKAAELRRRAGIVG